MTDYDPLPDLAALAASCYGQVYRGRYLVIRDPLRELVNGLGLMPEQCDSPAAWLAALRQAAGDRVAELEAKVAGLVGDLDKAEDRQVHIVPQGLDVHTAMTFVTEARPGDVLREAVTGREWVRTGHNTWLRRPGTKGADGVLTCV